MKKILLTKTKPITTVQIVSPAVESINGDSGNKNYLKRKSMQPAYQDLFQALLRLPDKQVQARVLDAINGQAKSPKMGACGLCQQPKRTYASVATQTASITIVTGYKSVPNNHGVARVICTTTTSEESEQPNATNETKRRRRRKILVPQVIKKSQARQVLERQTMIPKRKIQTLKDNKNDVKSVEAEDTPSSKRPRSSSIQSEYSVCSDLLDNIVSQMLHSDFPPKPIDNQKLVLDTMADEFLKAKELQPNGLIPLHSAITENDITALKLQIYVWQKLKSIDLNDLLTDDDEDCLQLALVEKAAPDIVAVLLKSGLEVDTIDAHSNTVLHLALLNDANIQVLPLLMEHIDLKLLLQINDDGYTPLHLAVRRDLYLQVEAMLNIFDRRLFGAVIFQRDTELNREIDSKKHFLEFYKNHCEYLKLEHVKKLYTNDKQNLKRKLLDSQEMCSGNTALLTAIENKMEHLIYFLLAHFTDPRVENHSGQNARSYFGEFAKQLNLSLNMDKGMNRIVNLLEL